MLLLKRSSIFLRNLCCQSSYLWWKLSDLFFSAVSGVEIKNRRDQGRLTTLSCSLAARFPMHGIRLCSNVNLLAGYYMIYMIKNICPVINQILNHSVVPNDNCHMSIAVTLKPKLRWVGETSLNYMLKLWGGDFLNYKLHKICMKLPLINGQTNMSSSPYHAFLWPVKGAIYMKI